jgi:hypothetical protein
MGSIYKYKKNPTQIKWDNSINQKIEDLKLKTLRNCLIHQCRRFTQ